MSSPSFPRLLVLGGYSDSPNGDPPAAGTGLRTLALAGSDPASSPSSPAPPSEPSAATSYVTVAQEPLTSPTWIEPHPTSPWLLSIGETSPSELVCTAIDEAGSLSVLDRRTTGGDDGCHLAIAPGGEQVVVAHYGSGTVESFGLDEAGRLSGPVASWTTSAPTGPDAERQDGPHAHQVVFDPHSDELLVCDLGTDRIHRLRLHPDGQLSEAAPAVVLHPGSGPRHLVVVDDLLLVACELSVELWVARRTDEGWQHSQTVPTTSRSAAEQAEAGAPVLPTDVRLSGDQVLVATRGVDTVSTFALDRDAAAVAFVAEVSCQGRHPRDLVVADGLVWLADQWSDAVVALDLQAVVEGGDTPPVVRIATPAPSRVLLR